MVERFTDMEYMLGLDPIHEVDPKWGWRTTYERPLVAAFPPAHIRDACFDRIELAFNKASESVDLRVHDVYVGGEVVRLKFASPGMEEMLLRSFAPAPHRSEPTISIGLLDSAARGIEPPELPVQSDNRRDSGQDSNPADDVRYAINAADGQGGGDYRALNVYRPSTRTGYFWTRDSTLTPWWDRAAPLRTLLHFALTGADRHLVHAAAVGTNDQGVLLPGRGGSGKSTLSVTALLDGLYYVGDDCAPRLLGRHPGRPFALSRPRSSHRTPTCPPASSGSTGLRPRWREACHRHC